MKSSNHFKALFRKIQAYNPKDPLDGKRFDDIKIIHAVNCYFEVKDKSYYIEGMKSLSIVGLSALSLREIILKNKNDFAPYKTCIFIFIFSKNLSNNPLNKHMNPFSCI